VIKPDFAVVFIMKIESSIKTSDTGYFLGAAILKYLKVKKCSLMLVFAVVSTCNRNSTTISWINRADYVKRIDLWCLYYQIAQITT
jgi:hypothetical protein